MMADRVGTTVVAHPGKSSSGGENEWLSVPALQASDEVRQVKTHFARNRDIAFECEELIAMPRHTQRPQNGTGGGTWYTVGQAEKQGKPVRIIWPDGVVETVCANRAEYTRVK